ncbi:MAG: ATPase, T2SS/T4P/T4SS family, partial [Nanoarchaeota archaeon]
FRMISGRPLDEANPILDTQLEIGNLRARIAIVQQPLSCDGLSYSIRRHRESPWTLPLFVKNKMLNPFAAGLLSFLVDGARTLLVAGTRSSGKTSLLGSLMLEIVPKHRIIVIEDSLELPVESLRKLNYDILRMKVRSALLKTTTEVSADDGIRTSLRLGDSCLIIGEVRSVEAKALYEAMRVGALANVVAGTIHGASPYGVFDRVVNDLEVPITSFKATDSIIVCNPIKSPDGLHSWKRLVQLSEVRKHWTKDPLAEKGFVDLMKYNIEKDEIEPTEDLINGESEIIKDVAANVRGWAGNWDAVYDNVLLRAKIKKEIVDVSKKTGDADLLECKFNTLSNHTFHRISDEVIQEIGLPLGDRVFPLWQKWLNEEIKKRMI